MNNINKKESKVVVRMKQFFSVLMACLCAMLMTACASTTNSTGSPKSVVAEKESEPVVQRAEARWAAMLEHDEETAYAFYSPGYRSTTSVVDFMFQERSRRVQRVSAEFTGHDCTANSCKVRFNTTFEVRQAVPGLDVYTGVDEIEETWVKTQDEWWFVPPN
jgi:hypothetical protein